jgi:hypothetical protein
MKMNILPIVEQEVTTLPQHLISPPVFSWVRVTRTLVFVYCFVDHCLSFLSFFLLAIMLSVLRFTDSDYPIGIFKLFFNFLNSSLMYNLLNGKRGIVKHASFSNVISFHVLFPCIWNFLRIYVLSYSTQCITMHQSFSVSSVILCVAFYPQHFEWLICFVLILLLTF